MRNSRLFCRVEKNTKMNSNMKTGSFDEIIATKNATVYGDDRIAFIENLQRLGQTNPVRLEVVFAVLCLRGKASLYINDKSYEVKANDLLICHPNVIVEKSMVSVDMEFRCVCLSPEYVGQMVQVSNGTWDILKFLEKSPVISLRQDEVDIFCQYYNLIRSRLDGEATRGSHWKEVIDALLQAFLFEFHDTMERFVKFSPPTYSSGERLFKNFVNLLTSSYPKQRRVDFYAEQLHVTPKYLSSVCKQLCGKTPSTLIDQYVMRDIQYLLKKTDKSIKEISNELDFPNLSFFGKFVKKQTGFSPKFYREQNWNE